MTLMVGPIRFETVDGDVSTTATYTKHPALRPYQIMFRGTWHVQNRCESGVWVYRALPGPTGTSTTDAWVKAD